MAMVEDACTDDASVDRGFIQIRSLFLVQMYDTFHALFHYRPVPGKMQVFFRSFSVFSKIHCIFPLSAVIFATFCSKNSFFNCFQLHGPCHFLYGQMTLCMIPCIEKLGIPQENLAVRPGKIRYGHR
jgi:hypothetical protein